MHGGNPKLIVRLLVIVQNKKKLKNPYT